MERITIEQLQQRLSTAELSSGSIFGAQSSDATRFLLERGRIWRARAGEAVFQYGDAGSSFFVVCAGSLDFFKQKDGNRCHTRTVSSGEEVGFVAMIALLDRAGTAIAREDSLLLEIDSSLFSDLHHAYPEDFGLLSLNLARDMARTIGRLMDILVDNSIQY